MKDPIKTASKVLASIQENIRRISEAIEMATAEETALLKGELRLARKQEREARKYV